MTSYLPPNKAWYRGRRKHVQKRMISCKTNEAKQHTCFVTGANGQMPWFSVQHLCTVINKIKFNSQPLKYQNRNSNLKLLKDMKLNSPHCLSIFTYFYVSKMSPPPYTYTLIQMAILNKILACSHAAQGTYVAGFTISQCIISWSRLSS